MPLKVYPPRPGKTPNCNIRGVYLGVAVDRSAGTSKRAIAEKQRKKLEQQIERGEYPEKPRQADSPTFLSAVVAYMKAGRPRRYLARLLEHFADTPVAEIDQAAVDEAALILYPRVAPATRNACVY